jgi:hypothetical protein
MALGHDFLFLYFNFCILPVCRQAGTLHFAFIELHGFVALIVLFLKNSLEDIIDPLQSMRQVKARVDLFR